MADQPESTSTSLWNRSKQALGGRGFTFLQHQRKASESPCLFRHTLLLAPCHLQVHPYRFQHIFPDPSCLSGGYLEDEDQALVPSVLLPWLRSNLLLNLQATLDSSLRVLHTLDDESRTHRERKENYIKSLEREVLRLREEEAEILQTSKAFQQENTMLKEILSRHSIPIPDRTASLEYVATVSVRDVTNGGQCLQVTMPEVTDYADATLDTFRSPFSASMETSSPSSAHTATAPIREFSAQSSGGAFGSESPNQQKLTSTNSLNSPQIGIDFVLSLEQPCLGHTRGDGGISSEVPSGHALTAQAPLLTSAPPALTPSSTWQIPAIEIDRLLDLSSQLNLLGEVTPVQAWARLRAYPKFDKLSRDTLESLKQALMSEVHCYGFGAVIDEGIFEALLQQAFYGL